MRVYLDICCLKRPFDDQTQPRIQMETAAVLAIQDAVAAGRVTALRSLAHDLENSRNPDAHRASLVKEWLDGVNPPQKAPREVIERVRGLHEAGLKPLDAYHVAWAEHLVADVLVTTDDRLQSQIGRMPSAIHLRVTDPITLARELER